MQLKKENFIKIINKRPIVIWGARIDPSMEGKIRVMTIITGVTSPYILGKIDRSQMAAEEADSMSHELGIDMLK